MSTKLDEEILNDNKKYGEAYASKGIDIKPAKKLVIVSCMDARLNPQDAMGCKLGDVTVVRNAGASAVEGARSVLATTHLLGAKDVYVIKHTKCGLLGVPKDVVHSVMKQNLGVTESTEVDSFDPLLITDLGESLRNDVEYLRNHPLALKDVRVTGWIHDTDTGLLHKIVE